MVLKTQLGANNCDSLLLTPIGRGRRSEQELSLREDLNSIFMRIFNIAPIPVKLSRQGPPLPPHPQPGKFRAIGNKNPAPRQS